MFDWVQRLEISSSSGWADVGSMVATFLGLFIAAWALTYARKAWKDTQANLTIAEENLVVMKAEVARARAELAKASALGISLTLLRPERRGQNGERLLNDTVAEFTLEIDVTNYGGTKTAEHVSINVRTRPDVKLLRWSNQDGSPSMDPNEQHQPIVEQETLHSSSGPTYDRRLALPGLIPRVSDGSSMVQYVSGSINLDPDHRQSTDLPFNISVRSDDEPDELLNKTKAARETWKIRYDGW